MEAFHLSLSAAACCASPHVLHPNSVLSISTNRLQVSIVFLHFLVVSMSRRFYNHSMGPSSGCELSNALVHPQDVTYPTPSPVLNGVGYAAHVGFL
ncbi:Hypothetical predicted protein [Mytilus galloprovincialis]|uniref:Uncharacterized protein n=1 Tax=Mytilus galloprovincialis TaxID=29158 RepID=A0A8B6C681_MYTGA|nr:Hypothetical predicted protein [Mytilus galloprovincialis]